MPRLERDHEQGVQALDRILETARLSSQGLWQAWLRAKDESEETLAVSLGHRRRQAHRPDYQQMFSAVAGRNRDAGAPGQFDRIDLQLPPEHCRWSDGDWARWWLALGMYADANQVAGRGQGSYCIEIGGEVVSVRRRAKRLVVL